LIRCPTRCAARAQQRRRTRQSFDVLDDYEKRERRKPSGALAEAIDRDFGSFDDFKTKFNEAGVKQFGSGWVFLVSNGDKLEIKSMPNQDTPLHRASSRLWATTFGNTLII
jgi:superoxide dismutase